MAHPVIGWPWTQWLCRYAYAVDAAVSFNYEMLLEVVLQNYSKLKLWGMTDEARSDRVLVFKPHGSIDYTTSTTTWKDVSLPTDRYLAYSNSDMRLMMPGELRDVRPQPFAILPTEASHFVEHWQFQMCFDRWKTTIAPRLTHVVIVGLSYSLCDRSEIDELLSAVSPRAKIVVADPYPSEDLKAMILESGRPYTQWLDGPKPL